MSISAVTPSQTVGPFFRNCLLGADTCRNVLVSPKTAGDRIRIEGHVYDGDGLTVPDALVEIWQANSLGRYCHPADKREALPLDPSFTGFGRSGTDERGCYWFETIKPGRVPFDDTRTQAPHVAMAIFARGLLNHLFTRLYFADEETNDGDPILRRVPAERRSTLLAQRHVAEKSIIYHFDIILQGAGETVFFNL